MGQGTVRAIHIATEGGAPLVAKKRVRAVAGKGIEGDRYFAERGTFSKKKGPDRHVTLIEEEALEALLRDYGVRLAPRETRRNLLTRGVALNHLVGKEFIVGSATLRGIRLCEPCKYLEKKTRAGVREGLIHRGGLRAEIVRTGEIAVGDEIE